MMTGYCAQSGDGFLTGALCVVYDFQTLLTGLLAIAFAVWGGLPVWRQLKDTNLQTRISHRETLSTLLRDALSRHAKVEESLREPLALADRMTRDPIGEPQEIGPVAANNLEHMFNGVLDWYLVVLKDTESAAIEERKAELKVVLDRLVDTLNDAHWADHNEQSDEDHHYSDEVWAEILERQAAAQVEAADRIRDVRQTLAILQEAQTNLVAGIRAQIAKLDLQLSAPD